VTSNGSAKVAEAQSPAWVAQPEGHGVCSKIVGVLGGGQLGRMLCEAASPLAIRVAVLDAEPEAPSTNIAYRHMVGAFRDPAAVLEFAKK